MGIFHFIFECRIVMKYALALVTVLVAVSARSRFQSGRLTQDALPNADQLTALFKSTGVPNAEQKANEVFKKITGVFNDASLSDQQKMKNINLAISGAAGLAQNQGTNKRTRGNWLCWVFKKFRQIQIDITSL